MTRTTMIGGSVADGVRGWGRGRPWGHWVLSMALSSALLGCSLDSLLKNNELPTDVTDPALTTTPAGALAVYNGTLIQLQTALGGETSASFTTNPNAFSAAPSFVPLSGLFADEFTQPSTTGTPAVSPVNQRSLSAASTNGDVSDVVNVFSSLQRTRGQAGQAIQLLNLYRPDDHALVGHMYAVEAYAEIMLGELFCSGVPLSTLDYNGDFTLRPGSATQEIFNHVLALLDTGLTLAADSARIVNMIHVAQGRALLALGQYAAAGTAVADVPDDYTYAVGYAPTSDLTTTGTGYDARNFATQWGANASFNFSVSVADHEGINGLGYVSANDPRVVTSPVTGYQVSLYRANKYATTGDSPIVLASGVEARLIQAEAALQAGDVPTWLATLNELRTGPDVEVPADTIADTLGVSGCGNGQPLCGHGPGGDDPVEFGEPAGGFPVPSGYGLVEVDTTYPAPAGVGGGGGLCDQRSWYEPCYAGDSMVVYVYVNPAHTEPGMGTGGVAGLGALSDPGTPDGRIDLMFRERAFWLFATGHRQGDLRRLVREYHRPQNTVYPAGPYPLLGNFYGTDVSIPVPSSEKASNPLFTGCASTGA